MWSFYINKDENEELKFTWWLLLQIIDPDTKLYNIQVSNLTNERGLLW